MSKKIVGFLNKEGRRFAYNPAFLKHESLIPVYADHPEAHRFKKVIDIKAEVIDDEALEVKPEPKPKPQRKRKSIIDE